MMNSGERISRACPNRMLAAIIAHDGELHVSREDVNAMAERSISRLGSPHGEECKIIRAFKHIKPWSPRSRAILALRLTAAVSESTHSELRSLEGYRYKLEAISSLETILPSGRIVFEIHNTILFTESLSCSSRTKREGCSRQDASTRMFSNDSFQ